MPAFVTPLLFFGGLLSIAAPILIHILNKRRFRRVDWGAMEFLRRAQRIQRRRIKLEELLLLLLRCLALVLFGFALARPYFTGDAARFVGGARYERIVLIDDSLSMNAGQSLETSMDRTRRLAHQWLSEFASREAGDSFTILTTSRPARPLLVSSPLTEAVAGQILEEVKALPVSAGPGDLDASLAEIGRRLDQDRGEDVNRVVYILSDLRARDWSQATGEGEAGETVIAPDLGEQLRNIADSAAGCFLIDVGRGDQGSLLIEGIIARDKALVAGVMTEFDVAVRNHGSVPLEGIRVALGAGSAPPRTQTIDRLEPGEARSIPFPWKFPGAPDPGEPGASVPEASAVPLIAEVSLTGNGPGADALPDDNRRYFPARLVEGIRTLIIDGDPAGNFGQSESYFLARALAPPGNDPSGVAVTVADESDFDSLDLDDYQVIFLCNVFAPSPERATALERWTASGGGLVLALGDQVDPDAYHNDLFKDGRGLLPARLGEIAGDETEEAWAFIETADVNHPMLRLFESGNNPLRNEVKIFRWWTLELPGAAEGEEPAARVVGRFTDTANSPAFVEAPYGEGKVFVVATPLDADWGDWPLNVSYLVAVQELTRHMAASDAGAGSLAVGQPIEEPVDLGRYLPQARVTAPGRDPVTVQARPPEAGAAASEWRLAFEETGDLGFYTVDLAGAGGESNRRLLYAVNADPGESDLRRVNEDAFAAEIDAAGIDLVTPARPLGELGVELDKSNLWRWALFALLGVLCLELWFGWRIGRSRR